MEEKEVYYGVVRGKTIRVPEDVYVLLGEPRYMGLVLTADGVVLRPYRDGDVCARLYRKRYVKGGREYRYVYVRLPSIILNIYGVLRGRYYKLCYNRRTKQLLITFFGGNDGGS